MASEHPERARKEALFGWNELEFLSWSQFQKMAPAIVRLEARQLQRIQPQAVDCRELNTAIAWAIVTLRELATSIEQSPSAQAAYQCSGWLERAVLAITFAAGKAPAPMLPVLQNVLDHLGALQKRWMLLYE